MQKSQQQLQEIIAKSWSDPEFKQQLINNPAAVLKQHGIEVPDGKQVKVVADDEHTLNMVIPQKPDQLNDEQLTDTVGGMSVSSVMCSCSS